MKTYRADLHIHTVLSPCGDLEMSAVNILAEARKKKIDILGIADHNHTGNALHIKEMARKEHISVLTGAEVTTREEVHCLAFLEGQEMLRQFQIYLESHIVKIPNQPEILGYQVMINASEEVTGEVPYYLGSSLDVSIEELEKQVHDLGGLFIPAHIDRSKNSIFSQLGFLPEDLSYDALEISWRTRVSFFLEQHPELKGQPVITSSDAHFPDNIGRVTTSFVLHEPSLEEIRLAFQGMNGRQVFIE